MPPRLRPTYSIWLSEMGEVSIQTFLIPSLWLSELRVVSRSVVPVIAFPITISDVFVFAAIALSENV